MNSMDVPCGGATPCACRGAGVQQRLACGATRWLDQGHMHRLAHGMALHAATPHEHGRGSLTHVAGVDGAPCAIFHHTKQVVHVGVLPVWRRRGAWAQPVHVCSAFPRLACLVAAAPGPFAHGSGWLASARLRPSRHVIVLRPPEQGLAVCVVHIQQVPALAPGVSAARAGAMGTSDAPATLPNS